MWRSKIDPRVQGNKVERPDSSCITFVPRKLGKGENEKIKLRELKWKRKRALLGSKT
jgi:hypothetical protein